MRSLMVLAALLGMVVSLHAKETDSSRVLRGSDAAVKQFVSNRSGQPRSKLATTRPSGRKDREFSAEAIVPDICTGC